MLADVMNKVLVGKLFRVFVAKIMGHEVTAAADRTDCTDLRERVDVSARDMRN